MPQIAALPEARSLRSRLVELRVSLADLEARIAAVSAAPPVDGRPPPDDGKWLLSMLRHADNAAARRTPEAAAPRKEECTGPRFLFQARQTLESAAQLASLVSTLAATVDASEGVTVPEVLLRMLTRGGGGGGGGGGGLARSEGGVTDAASLLDDSEVALEARHFGCTSAAPRLPLGCP